MRGFSRTWPFLFGIVIVYLAPAGFGLVLGATDASRPAAERAKTTLAVFAWLALMIYPAANMVVGFFSGWRQGRVWLVPLVAAALSIPFTIAQIGPQGWVGSLIYAGIYVVFGLVGWFFGWKVHDRQSAQD
jgi:hypothetical protein